MASIAVPLAKVGPGISEGSAEIVARLERVPITGFHTRARLILGSCTFFDGFDSLAIAYVLSAIVPLWKLTPSATGLLISIGYVGAFAGAIVFGLIAERWGRMPSLLSSVALFSLATLASGFATDFNQLFTFRIIAGFALAGEVPVGTAYISEFAHAKGRGFFFLIYELTYAIGMVVVAFVAMWVLPNLGWRSMFFIGAIPALIVIGLRMALPESPRWLANNGQYAEADAIMKKIELEATNGDLGKLPPLEIRPVAVAATRWQELFEGRYLSRTVVSSVIYFCVFYTNFSLVQWAPTLYRTVLKVPPAQALQYATITSVVGLLGTLVCALTVDRVGRKLAFAGSFLIAGVAELALWLMGVQSALQMVIMITIAYFFISYMSILLQLYVPELFPTRTRALAAGFSAIGNRVASAIAPMLVAAVLVGLGLSSVFLMYGIVLIAGFLISLAFCVETKNKVLEEIAP